MKYIIYQNDEGVSILNHVDFSLTIKQLAIKDVPYGVPYLIVDSSDIPTDRSERGAWEADFSNPDGYGGKS